MPGFLSYDDLIMHVTVSGYYFDYNFFKVATGASQTQSNWQTLWTAAGTPPAGTYPAAQTTYTNDTSSINLANNSPMTKAMITFGGTANQSCTLMLYDRLVTSSGVITSTTGNKTVTTPSLGRYTSGVGVEAWMEVSQATNTTAPVVNMVYTDSVNPSQTGASLTFPAAVTVVSSMYKLPFAAGSYPGVKSVQTLNIGTASASTGIVNVVLIKPLLYLPIVLSQWNERDCILQLTSLPTIYDGASLGVMILTSANVTTTVWGQIRIAWS